MLVATYLDLDACIERPYRVPYSDCLAHVGATVLKVLLKSAAVLYSGSVFCVGNECRATSPHHITPQRQLLTIHKQHTVTTNIGGRLSNMFTANAQVTFVQ